MLALHDTEAATEASPEASDGSVSQSKSADAHAEELMAARCKKISFDLYTSINQLASVAEMQMTTTTIDDETFTPSIAVTTEQVRAWLSALKELNCSISEYARASVARVDRLQVEMALAQNAMASDLLDREACHTHTLETITRLQLDEDSAPTPRDTSGRARVAPTRVARAMNLVMKLHSSTAPFTFNEPQGYFGASNCQDKTADS
jgi:hypothetical protein